MRCCLRQNKNGVKVFGLDGLYTITPVEYKRGEPKDDDSDILQLTAQALCLEDMMSCEILHGFLYYGELRRRVKVEFDDELRRKTEAVINEMHEIYKRKYTPKVKRRKACNACSLKEICLPVICGKSALEYVKEMLDEESIL